MIGLRSFNFFFFLEKLRKLVVFLRKINENYRYKMNKSTLVIESYYLNMSIGSVIVYYFRVVDWYV